MGHAESRPDYELPELRQDLRLFEGPSDRAARTWVVYDPIRHRYYQISRTAYQLLSIWRAGSAHAFSADARRAVGYDNIETHVDMLAKFVIANNLAVDPPGGDATALSRQAKQARHTSLASEVLHNYLFFKIPLLRPNRLLASTLPFVAPAFTRTAAAIITTLGLIGLYLTSRQWDTFVATFVGYLNFEGALLFATVFAFVKCLHELGHAFAAAHNGVRVSSMGVAFVLMAPMLYTDVSDAWRLRDKRAKLAIDAAGIVVELSLAALALFAWAFLPDGTMRAVAFLIATTSLAMSLAINLNPLMKFDGYHILADFWGIANLQQRSNGLAIWRLREWLFGLGHAPPEIVPTVRRALMITYAILAWIYRTLVFFGIALLVYHTFFKVLGLVLFVVEIWWFILKPVVREVGYWWEIRRTIARRRRSIATAAFATLGVAAVVVPWSGTITTQGLSIAHQQHRIVAPHPARVQRIAVADGQHVTDGAIMFTLSMPELERDYAQLTRRIATAETRLARIAGDEADRSQRLVLEGELARDRSSLHGLRKELDRLVIRAPIAGVVRDVDPHLREGEWISSSSPLARVVGQGTPQIVAYVDEQDVRRLRVGAHAVFISDDPLQLRMTGVISDIAPTGSRALEFIQLSSVFGGAVPSDRTPTGDIKPRTGRHLVRISVDAGPLHQSRRGMVLLSGTSESLATAFFRRVLQILIRETSA